MPAEEARHTISLSLSLPLSPSLSLSLPLSPSLSLSLPLSLSLAHHAFSARISLPGYF